MKNLLKKIYIKYINFFIFFFFIVICSVKFFFWLIFVCLFLLQTIIILNLWHDMPIETENADKAIALYVFMTVGLLISVLAKKRFFVYIFALGMIILFLYLSTLPDLSSYFGYFDGLD